ncbi:16S rRNA (cytosine(967)-C(5))-methyltransferase RsmB [Desulfuromonas sp. AOP6]|uniref:16S rRNA (cytosine(967)-C(5))-methyltransferase RsmB n=1 Tax=Desulfuromonas sp. AOP6 TaxID=1566351 RepID=UPI001286FDF6|nr:16S rRNA (cytosine(967)-C(5))-methyltransferase RsmB [Desulfuromonas sp. AOP6]BCA80931.1 ribosomal RNA small subunit methyltransferase B [Desulfuromonas sp. AOP6]
MPLSDPRKIALDILLRVEDGAYADLALNAAFEKNTRLDGRDRNLATELVYGALRQRGRLDFALSQLCKTPLKKLELKVLWLLRLGAYQILELDRIPASAAVNQAVELARSENLERATGFINGVLRNLARQREKIQWPDRTKKERAYLEHVLSVPRWLAELWIKDWGAAEAMALAESMLGQPPFTLRVNTLRLDRDSFLEKMRAAGHEVRPCQYAPEGVVVTRRGASPLAGMDEGWFQVQDEASMLISHLLDVRPGQRLLDTCAAPGGKTTHMAALTGNDNRLLALDLHPQRVRLILEGAQRLGCEGIEAKAWDMSCFPDFLEQRSFDRVLVDAPCSGLGVLRRNPEIRWRPTPPDFQALADLQGTILQNAALLVRPGGRLLYSLCTLTARETWGVVDDFLTSHPDFVLEDLRQETPAAWAPLFDERGALRTTPQRCGGMDAFFAARFYRKPSA